MKITPARARWIGRAGVLFLRSYGATWRVKKIGLPFPSDGSKMIFAFQHGDILMAARIHRWCGAAILVSEHGDGEIIAQVVERYGYVPVRGSSTRGGVRGLLELMRDHPDRILAITPDGPKGPAGSVQEGVIAMAARTGRYIVPASYAYGNCRRLKSWDRFAIPRAFSRVVEHLGEPLVVPSRVDDAQRAAFARELEQRFVSGAEAAQRAL